MNYSSQRIQTSSTEVVTTTNSTALDARLAGSLVVSAVVDVNTPSAGTSAAANWNTSDIITITSHGFTTGLVGQVTTSGVLPTGISGATNYFVYVITANTFYLYDTLANALVGGATGRVNITNVGSGNHTFTPTAIAGASVRLQGIVNEENAVWTDVPDCTESVTADGTFVWELDYLRYPQYRVQSTLTSGRFTVVADAVLRAED